MMTGERGTELMKCFRKPFVPGEPRCSIIDGNTTWEGSRWTETHESKDTMTIGGMTIPLWVEFLVCSEHEPKEEKE